jgi:YHS domain-containing protein
MLSSSCFKNLIWRYAMKRLMMISLALALIASMGCSGEPQRDEEAPKGKDISADKISSTNRPRSTGSVPPSGDAALPESYPYIPYTDPVDGTEIENIAEAKDSCLYRGQKLYFNSKKNRELFEKDPEKYPGRLQKR